MSKIQHYQKFSSFVLQKLYLNFPYSRQLNSFSSWEEKNRFKVYKGLYFLTQGKFSESGKLLIESVPTFNTEELISFENLVCYAVSLAMLTMTRRDLKSKCIEGQEIQEGLYGAPLVKNYLKSLYNCSYGEFLQNLGNSYC